MADFVLLVYYFELVYKYKQEILLMFSMSDSFNSHALLMKTSESSNSRN